MSSSAAGAARSRGMRSLWGVLLAGVVLVVAACTGGDDAVARGGDFEFIAPGGQSDIFYDEAERQEIPEIAGEDLFDEDTEISVSDFAGDVVVLNLWGQWCAPCRTETSELQEVYEQTQDQGVQVLGIDVREQGRSAPQDFMRDRDLTYPSIYDPSGRSLLGLSGYPRNVVPSTIVVDRQQRVAAVFLRDLLASDLLPVVQDLAAEEPADQTP